MADDSEEKKTLVSIEEVEHSWRKSVIPKKLLQAFHFALAVGIFVIGLVEFCVEPTIFDIFGRSSEQRAQIPAAVFKVSML